MKKIPIGIDNFYKLVDENYYFADKTIFIKDIIEESSQVLLIPRPRRFGKSLNMSMLRYFFTNKNAEKNRELFNGLKIEKETEIMKLQGKYPLIYISFKDVKELSWENCYGKTTLLISNLFNEFEYLLNSDKLNKKTKNQFEKIWMKEAVSNLASAKARCAMPWWPRSTLGTPPCAGRLSKHRLPAICTPMPTLTSCCLKFTV